MSVSRTCPSRAVETCDALRWPCPAPVSASPTVRLNKHHVRSSGPLGWPWQGPPAPPHRGFPLSAFLVCAITDAPTKPQCGRPLESRNTSCIPWPAWHPKCPPRRAGGTACPGVAWSDEGLARTDCTQGWPEAHSDRPHLPSLVVTGD